MKCYKLITGLISLMIGLVLLVFIMNMAVTVDDETETENHSRSNDDNMLPDFDEDDMTSLEKKYLTFAVKHLIKSTELEKTNLVNVIDDRLKLICQYHPTRKDNVFLYITPDVDYEKLIKDATKLAETKYVCTPLVDLVDTMINCKETSLIEHKYIKCQVIVQLNNDKQPVHLEAIDATSCVDGQPYRNLPNYKGKCTEQHEAKNELKK